MMAQLDTLKTTADQYRQSAPDHKSGIVLIWEGSAYGWKNELRDPQSERPGVYAVDDEGQVFQAVGGNDYDGAKRWEPLQ